MAEVNWGMMRPRNPFAEVQEGYEFGRQIKADRDRESAYDMAAQDPQKGRMALMRAGEYRAADQIGQDMDAEAQRKAEALKAQEAATMDMLKRLSMVPEGQRLPWLRQNAPRLASVGLDPNELADETEEGLSDANLLPVIGQVQEAYKQFFRDPQTGEIIGAKASGAMDVLRPGTPQPMKPVFQPEGTDMLVYEGGQWVRKGTNPKTYAPQRSGGGGRGGGPAAPTGGKPWERKW